MGYSGTIEERRKKWKDWYQRKKEEQRPRIAKNKRNRILNIRKIIVDLKKQSCCKICGFADYRALHFHHIRGTKKFNIAEAAFRGSGVSETLKEIAKCEILCANCHLIEHNKIRE